MTLVIDASVTMAWCFEDEATEATDALLDLAIDDGFVVPGLWRAEVANVLLVAQRRGRVTDAQRDRFLSLVDQLAITVESSTPDSAGLIWLTEKHQLSAYDAWYLWLAIRTGSDLATTDQRLAKAGRRTGLTVLP